MMYEFLANNRSELTLRCKAKVSQRPGRSASSIQLDNGIPMFLDQLIRTLRVEQTTTPMDSRAISGPAGGVATLSEVGASAARHGKDLLQMGYTVNEVVHDYGDLCQAITDLAVERDTPFQVTEFRTLNRCLDNAIADAVTEFSYQQGLVTADRVAIESNKRASFFAHELRNILGTASLAFGAAKTGNLNLHGATGAILERSLNKLSKLIDASVVDVREQAQHAVVLNSFSVAQLIEELVATAQPVAQAKGCPLSVKPVDPDLAISGNRELLLSALATVLQNAIEFTQTGTEVVISAHASAEQIHIDVANHCGDLPANAEQTMLQPSAQYGAASNAPGLDLTTARYGVAVIGGTLGLRDVPTVGCVFTVSLPRLAMPT